MKKAAPRTIGLCRRSLALMTLTRISPQKWTAVLKEVEARLMFPGSDPILRLARATFLEASLVVPKVPAKQMLQQSRQRTRVPRETPSMDSALGMLLLLSKVRVNFNLWIRLIQDSLSQWCSLHSLGAPYNPRSRSSHPLKALKSWWESGLASNSNN